MERSFPGRIPRLFEMETRDSSGVDSAAAFARLLQQVKPVFELLRTVKIGSASASADVQLGAGEFTPRRQSPAVPVRKMA